ncbi:BMP family ABC transporter substrate-binding protein [Treponema sp. J25]|uniref:BMP family ABC transporter substrate-binding protein n=1 Tax=Treponema sp. J25 TaxID=2094121 RepID=UPI00104C5394|nr:BMP family ABC transporter substrate-binding protein [Treponema sp. J25]TCW62070.1 BMP family ABC transporter substrate-binding protein [Treponema sp. J25]
MKILRVPEKRGSKFLFVGIGFILSAALAVAGGVRDSQGSGANTGGTPKKASIAVFVPGVTAGSPVYEMLVKGVERAIQENPGVALKILEAGYNQAEWETKLTSLAATGQYDLIVSSNPALPALCAQVAKKFPRQKFLLLDGELAGNPQIYTLRYNQREQGYMAGYLAALYVQDLARRSGNAGKTVSKRLGLLAGQEYPAMNEIILPGFRSGAQAVDPAFEVDFRVLGNWYDASKAGELARSMIRGGAQVILPIAGGGNQGVLQAAEEAAIKVLWFDVNGYALKPGVVIGSSILRQDRAAYEKVTLYLQDKLPFGKADLVGVREGYVDFVDDDPLYLQAVPAAVRESMGNLLARLRKGELIIPEREK